MPIYPTGTTRTITYTVTGTMTGHQELYIDPGTGSDFEVAGSANELIFRFLPGLGDYAPFARLRLGAVIYGITWEAFVKFGLFGPDDIAFTGNYPDSSASYSITESQSFTVTCSIPDVETWFEVVDLPVGDYTIIDSVKWPSFGASAVADFLEARKKTVFEIIPSGTIITITATIGGATATVDYTLPSDEVMTYPVVTEGEVESVVGLDFTPYSRTAQSAWQYFFQGVEFGVASWTGGGVPDSQGSYANTNAFSATGIFNPGIGSGFGTATVSHTNAPPCRYDCAFRGYGPDGSPLSSPLKLWLWDRHTGSSYGYKEVTASPDYSEEVVQELYALAGSTNLKTYTGQSRSQWQGIRWNIAPDTPGGEDPNDWRVMSRGLSWIPATLRHEAEVVLADGSSATGWTGVTSSGGRLVVS